MENKNTHLKFRRFGIGVITFFFLASLPLTALAGTMR